MGPFLDWVLSHPMDFCCASSWLWLLLALTAGSARVVVRERGGAE